MSNIFFIISNLIFRPLLLADYLAAVRNLKKSTPELLEEQEKILRSVLISHAKNFSRFRPYLESLQSTTNSSIKNTIESLPVITKKDIRNDTEISAPSLLKRLFAKKGKTGGSTGEPLQYWISRRCARGASVMLYRGWGYAGYKLGDKVAVLAGGSLVSHKPSLLDQIKAKINGLRKYSSYGVDDETFFQYATDMKRWGAKYLRGYVSSVFEFARFIERSNVNIEFRAIFTTAEMLTDMQREVIERVFRCPVYNNYGLNDGAITAFECSLHNGFHIDLERGYLEVVDENNKRVWDKPGRILATSLLNRVTPFVRYDTGDIGLMTRESCACGNPYPLLKNLSGRRTDTLKINGKLIGSPVLTVLMSGTGVLRYQFIQENQDELCVRISKGNNYSKKIEDYIKDSLFLHVGEFNLIFDYSENFEGDTAAGKWRVVVNRSMDKLEERN
ncbi:phenylacetate--CoA ligase family protein [Stenotrophomonas sp. W1S232]|uniref:Phenylacetate--CoA ligase family protein n=1 Tax=Stenotrophomonas koreensis TaxID=266128 RepID=A0A7W3UY21_9GAMM|nr:phenylacetate--CoA ligase family protein [Stenotrophomonas koreensis]MBB1115963.1 phenylacetate--CoA ligase family protein [Stenotrophomonas koreensis]